MKALLSISLSTVFILALIFSTPLSSGTVGMRMINAALNDNAIESVQVFPPSQSTKQDESSSYIVKVSRSKQDQNSMPPFSVALSLVADPNLAKQLDEKAIQQNNQDGKQNRVSAQARFNYPILRFEEGVDAKNSTLVLSGLQPGAYSFNVMAKALSDDAGQAQSNPARLQVLNPKFDPASSTKNIPTFGDQPSTSANTNGLSKDIVSERKSNHAPVAKAGQDLQVIEGSKVLLDASDSTDVDKGDILSFKWDQVLPQAPEVKLTQLQSSSPKASFEAPNVQDDTTFRFRLIVKDNRGGLSTDLIQVLVKYSESEPPTVNSPNTLPNRGEVPQSAEISQNHAPVATITESVSTAQNRPLIVLLQANDPEDGDKLTYSILLSPSHGTIAAFDKSSGRVTYLPSFGFSGKDTLSFKVTDSKGAESNEGVVSISVGESAAAASHPDSSTSAKLNNSSTLKSSDSQSSNGASVSSLSDSLQEQEERKTLLQQIRSEKLKETRGEKVPNQYIIVLKNDIASDRAVDIVNDAKSRGAKLLHQYQKAVRGFSVSIPNEEVLADILNSSDVAYAEPDVKVKSFTTEGIQEQILPTGVDRVDGDQSYTISGDGKGDKINADIAILDTGISLSHPDLNLFKDISFVPGVTSGNDDNGHGTMVAGIAAAEDNDIGVVGVAPGARLWAIKVLDSTGTGSLSSVIQGIDYVTQHANEIEVADMSFGCDDCASQILNNAITNAVSAGVTMVAAAGNDGKDASTFSPANHPEVIAVSAIADSDGKCGSLGSSISGNADDSLASFSNYGSAIDLAAPGVSIYSTNKDAGYSSGSGTSMAAPHVAGAAALYKAKNIGFSPSQIRNAIEGEGSLPSSMCDLTNGSNGHGYFKSDKDGVAEPILYVGITSNGESDDGLGSRSNQSGTSNNTTILPGSISIPPANLTFPGINGTLTPGNATNATLVGNNTISGNGTFSAQACCFCPSGSVVIINCGDLTTNDPDGKAIIDLHCGASPACNTVGSVRVAIMDPGANIDPTRVNVAYVHVSTGSDPTGFTVQMLEPGPNSANFTKLFNLGPTSIYPDTIAYSPGNTVELVYFYSPNPGAKAAQAAFFPPGSPDTNTISSGSDSVTLTSPAVCSPSSSSFTDRTGIGSSGSTSTTDYYFVRKWGTSQLLTSNFRNPAGIAVTTSCGVYVVDSNNNRIQEFQSDGTFVRQWGGAGSGQAQFKNPRSIAVDSAGFIYVADTGNSRIQKFLFDGTFIDEWFAMNATGIETAWMSWCLCDLIYATDYSNGRIQGFQADGTPFAAITFDLPGPATIKQPIDVTVYPAGEGVVYVADRNNAKVQKFNSTGFFISEWGSSGSGNSQFNAISGIGLDISSNVFTTEDIPNNRLQKFNNNGGFITSVQNFDAPQDITADGVGNVYISEYLGDRIAIFTETLAPLTQWGAFSFFSVAPGFGPNAIALDSATNLYTSDQSNHRVLKFSKTGNAFAGQKLGSFGGNGPNEFNRPLGIGIDKRNQLVYVADAVNNRIKEYDAAGNLIRNFGATGTGPASFQSPRGIVVIPGIAPNGNPILVTDQVGNRIQLFAFNGGGSCAPFTTTTYPGVCFITQWGGTGTGDAQFNNPTGISVYNNLTGSFIFVSDSGNDRVQVFLMPALTPCISSTPVDTAGIVCFETKFGSPGGANGQFNNPTGIATDNSGNVYVADTGNNRLSKLTSSGEFLANIGTAGPGPNDGQLSFPIDVTVNNNVTEDGYVYVADAGNSRVQVFAPPAADISIDPVPQDPIWGISFTLTGSTIGANNGDTVSIDWGDGTTGEPPVQIQSGGTWSATHTYGPSAVGLKNIVANLVDSSNNVRDFSSTSVTVQKHSTTLDLEIPTEIVANTRYTAVGSLLDTAFNPPEQIPGKQITFTQSAGVPPLPTATTEGIVFDPGVFPNSLEVVNCSSCTSDSGTGTGNIVVHMMTNSEIRLPAGSTGVRITIDGMGTTPFTYEITKGDSTTITESSSGLGSIPNTLSHEFGEGIKSIRFTSVGAIGPGDFVSITNVATFDRFSLPQEQHAVDFEDLTAGTQVPGGETLVPDAGSYYSTAVSTTSNGITMLTQASYNPPITGAGSEYLGSTTDSVSSVILDNQEGTAGEPVTPVSYGGTIYKLLVPSGQVNVPVSAAAPGAICSGDQGGDSDNDAICDKWENPNTSGTPPNDSTHRYIRCPSSSGAFTMDTLCTSPTAKYNLCFKDQFADVWGNRAVGQIICPTVGHKDLYVEIDYMQNHLPDTNAIKDVIKAFGNAPVTGNTANDGFSRPGGITLHVIVDQQISRVTPITVWQNNPDNGRYNDDFKSIKERNFGLVNSPTRIDANNPADERTVCPSNAPCSIAAIQANLPLLLKHYVTKYGLWISNWQGTTATNCGPSGQAETLGNDFVVSLGCNFSGSDPAGGTVGSRDEQAGTFMHEVGHNLNLAHGGPSTSSFGSSNYNDNCKPNQLSVMSYTRQVPWGSVITPALWESNHFLDYSRGAIKTRTTNVDPQEGTSGTPASGLNEPNGLAGSGLIVYGTPSRPAQPLRTANLGAGIDWDGGGPISGTVFQDVNNFGINGCGATIGSAPNGQVHKSIDEWNNLAFYMLNDVDSEDGNFGDVRQMPELTGATVQKITKAGNQFSGLLQPINPDGSSIFNTGSTIPVKFQFRDANGNFITNAQVTFKADRISSSVTGTQQESIASPLAATKGTLFKYDAATNTYIYNWSTTGLQRGTYALKAFLNFGNPSSQTLLQGPPPIPTGMSGKVSLR